MAEHFDLPMQYLRATLAPDKAEPKRATMRWYSGSPVDRFSFIDGAYTLRFSTDPKHIRLDRLNSGNAPLLNAHRDTDARDVVGVVEQAWIENGEGRGQVKFSDNPEVAGIVANVENGILRNVSMGVVLHKLEDVTPAKAKQKQYLAVDWEPQEVSIVPVGADPNATFLAGAETFSCEIVRATAQKEERTNMPETTHTGSETAQITLSGQDALVILQIAKACNLDSTFAETYISKNTSVEDFRKLAIDEQAKRADQFKIHHQHVDVTRDHKDGLLSRMEESVVCRYTGKQPSDGARAYMNARLADLAREICVVNGLRPSYGDVVQLAMHSTSDFPNLLEGVGRRMLLDAYQQAASPIKSVVRRSSATDFRAKYALRISGAPSLEKVPEGGEVTAGTRFEAKESYSIATFAKIFGVTRQAIINDDLGAFADFTKAYGRSAAAREADNIVSVLYGANGAGITMDDGQPLFHSTHNNLASSGAAITDETLSAARLALRTAKDVDGATLIEAAPRYLLCPAALESTAEKYLASLYPAQAANVNPFSGKLELLVEPRLDAKSAAGWYIFASPEQAPVLEEAFLSGQEGVQVESRPGWEVLGVEFRAILDHGVGAIGTRGAWRNPGQ